MVKSARYRLEFANKECQRTPRTHQVSIPDNSQKRMSRASRKKTVNIMEWMPGNTKDMPMECSRDPQRSGGSTDALETIVIYKVQQIRSQRKRKLKVSYHATYKNKSTTNIFSRRRVMDHTPIKKACSPVKSTNKSCILNIGSYQTTITSRKRLPI